MPRRKLIVSKEYPYHVTARSNNKLWFDAPLSDVWTIFREKLVANRSMYGTVLRAFVLMSNHFHLILSTPEGNLGEVMRHLQTELSKAILRKARRINHVFGGRYSSSLLDSAYGYAYVYKYVLRNPVRAGISQTVEAYPYSSLLLEGEDASIHEMDGTLRKWIPKEREEKIRWLNRPAAYAAEQLITKGLRHDTFRFSKGNDVRKNLIGLETAYDISLPRQS